MKTINEHIKQNSFVHVYLLYGEEQQVVKIYRNRLLKAWLGTDSLDELKQDMNFSLFVGTPLDVPAVIEMASSYPFFAEKRVILIENCKVFSFDYAALSNCIRNLPETTFIIFTEDYSTKKKSNSSNKETNGTTEEENSDNNEKPSANTDEDNFGEEKKSRKKGLVSAIKEVGYVTEIDKQKQGFVENWIIRELSNSGKRISRTALENLLIRTDMDMTQIKNEMDKLIAFKGEDTDIKVEDVLALVSENPQEQVFKMIDAISDKKVDQAMSYYKDMLELRISPQKILKLTERHMRILYQVKDLRNRGFDSYSIGGRVKEIKQPKFTNKYINQASKFSMKEIADCMADCVDLNLKSRTGALTDRMAVELIIVKYSQRNKAK